MKTHLFLLALFGAAFANAAAHGEAANPATPPNASQTPLLTDAVPDKNGVRRMAILRGLDKISGRAIDINAPSGVPVRFGTLTITARYCYTVPPEEPPETAAFIQIDDGNPLKRVFSGWMFASTPALNGLEHPVYDVWVITCKTEEPATGAGNTAGLDPSLPPPVKGDTASPAGRGGPPNP
jgi:hypothetical protein